MSARASVGVCEDDDALRGILRTALERDGYLARVTASGTEAVTIFDRDPPDVLILDIGLADADGRDVCLALRARGYAGPVIFLTARDALPDRLSGFRAGGDDYLAKPFALAELLVRVQALLRRTAVALEAAAGVNGADQRLVLDPIRHAISGPQPVPLSPTEFRILGELSAKRGTVVRRAALVHVAWPDGAIVHENTLDRYVSRIRAKLRTAGRAEQVVNVRGVGYVLR